MSSRKAEGLFKVTVSQTPLDRINEAARYIISAEVDKRDANMKRLRTLRLARDAKAAAILPKQPATKQPRKKKA